MPHFVAAICRKPHRDQHQGGLAIGKRPDDTGTAPHLPNDSLQGVIGADLPPVGAGKRVVGQGLTDGLADQGRGRPQLQGGQLRDDRRRLGRGRLPILLGVDRLQQAGVSGSNPLVPTSVYPAICNGFAT